MPNINELQEKIINLETEVSNLENEVNNLLSITNDKMSEGDKADREYYKVERELEEAREKKVNEDEIESQAAVIELLELKLGEADGKRALAETSLDVALETQKLAEDKKYEAEAKLEKAKEELENENNNCIADLRTQLLEAEQRKDEIYFKMTDAILEGDKDLRDALENNYDSVTYLISVLQSELTLLSL